jgi:hypothetical protein
MPSSRFNLALIYADFSLQRAHDLQGSSLERLITFSDGISATHGAADLQPWQSELLQALRVDNTEFSASAPLTWCGAGGESEPGTWLHADPVRLEMIATGLALQAVSSCNVELNTIETELRQHLAASGLQWRSRKQNGFIYSPAPLQVRTVSPHYAATMSLREALPEGPDARVLRKLMTELQMVLHNKFQDASAPNAIWLWGLGNIPLPTQSFSESSSLLPRLLADDGYARGVYLAHHAEGKIAPLPESLDAVLMNGTDALVVLREGQAEQLEERWFAPALGALKSRWIKRIDLYLNGFRAVASYSPLKRWFAQPRPLHHLLAKNHDA